MGSSGWRAALACGCLALMSLAVGSAQAQTARIQQVELVPGWNAIYLEVDPTVSDPARLFAGTPVSIAAAHTMPDSGAQFVGNPSADLLQAYGWSVWYAPERPDAFLTTLFGISGAASYLLFAETNATLAISGTVVAGSPRWTPNAFHFTGFAVADSGAPTFQQFFAGSPAHNHNRLYRLVDGTWRQVLDPGAARMRSGEAFWIYCDGRSDYPGPLEVSTVPSSGVNLTSRGGSEIVFRNRTDHPISWAVEHIADPARPIPISTPVLALDESDGRTQTLSVHFDAGYFKQDFPPLEAGQAIRLPLALRVQDAGPGERHSLLQVTTDLGTVTYIPVTASRDDL
ncbi:MAG: hypothetical protein KBC66_11045 [Kiritimatiellae bacterium]|nr:hypothetical protein [Kiritimatiellia bacterium]